MADLSRDTGYTRIDRGPQNRYRRTRVYRDEIIIEGTRRFGVARCPIFDTTDAERHTVTSKDVGHMDLIAWEHYGDGNEHLWWVLALANNVKNPITDMFIGQQLLIPPINEIAAALEKVI